MTNIGDPERATQTRVMKLFVQELGYDSLGNRSDGENKNILDGELEHFLLSYMEFDRREDGPELVRLAITELIKTAENTAKSLYDRNRDVYEMLRYGVKVKTAVGAHKETVQLVDWKNPARNQFAVAEEVTVAGSTLHSHSKRPDIVLYLNGIAIGVLELKRSSVSVAEGIRQNLDSQKRTFIEHFFATNQLLMAGNDVEGLRYGSIGTTEKYYLTWKEPAPTGTDAGTDAGTDTGTSTESPLHTALKQLCNKERLLEIIHDFVVFDAGTKKLPRHNQYFGVRAAQTFIKRREGGIIWHTQGSGKTLTMVWLAKWIHENVTDGRVLIVTDRTELDAQIAEDFAGVHETIERARSGAALLSALNTSSPWLLCALVHKFLGKDHEAADAGKRDFLAELKSSLPKDFKAKGTLFVFVDECHRTQSGDLHNAMRTILPGAVFIGFTGTPLLKTEKKSTFDRFGSFIHTYKFDEAVRDKVVLDLRYESRQIDQRLTSSAAIDKWFEAKTKGLTELARGQLKQRWGTLQKVLSSANRLHQIVMDIDCDASIQERFINNRGNAFLVAGSIYDACIFYEMFQKTAFQGKCAIVSSYVPSTEKIKGEDSGEGDTDSITKYKIYRKMLADWFHESEESAAGKVEQFELEVKKKFIHEPGQMKLLIVVDKLLTGFDAPAATYLYIDKQMRDHGLFQAICRVNRLDGDDKEFGQIVDYKDLFQSVEGAVHDYTSGAFNEYDKDEVAGLLANRLDKAKERLEDALETLRGLCEHVLAPRDAAAFYRYFSSAEPGNIGQLKANERKRLDLYRFTASLIRAYAGIANELTEAGYTDAEIASLKTDVTFYTNLRDEVKIHSGDNIDLKQYESGMRSLIDTYIIADAARSVSTLYNLPLVQAIVERGVDALASLPERIRTEDGSTAEAIENNVRRLIIDQSPINPKYYERMSLLLEALIKLRETAAITYEAYLKQIIDLARRINDGPSTESYPPSLNTRAKRALYDNLGKNEVLALAVDRAVQDNLQADWRSNRMKLRRVRGAILTVLDENEELTNTVLALVQSQDDY